MTCLLFLTSCARLAVYASMQKINFDKVKEKTNCIEMKFNSPGPEEKQEIC